MLEQSGLFRWLVSVSEYNLMQIIKIKSGSSVWNV